MGALPKIRISKGRKNRRRAHHSLETPALASCPKCGKMRRPHFVCGYCQHYGEKPKATSTKKNKSPQEKATNENKQSSKEESKVKKSTTKSKQASKEE